MKALLTILLLACSPCSINVFSQAQEKEFSGYAVRFQERGDLASFFPIVGSGMSVGFTVSPLMTRDSQYSTRISMINLSTQRQGDEWDLSVTVTLPKHGGIRVMAVGRLKEGEKLTVDKFAEYDLLPSEVSIVKIDPVPALVPQIVNLTTTIEVVSVKSSIVPVPCRIEVKNDSHKAVRFLKINTYKGKQRLSEGWLEGGWDRYLIEAGATNKFALRTDTDYKRVADDEYQPDQANIIEIATVLFADWTFEGDAHVAGQIGAKTIGRRVQLDRLLSLINSAVESRDPETAPALANLKQAVFDLDVGVDPSYAEELKKRFPMLDEKALKDLEGWIPSGLEEIRSVMLGDISTFEKALAKNDSNSFQAWLVKENEKYQTARSRMY
jgi:hypothetical protein